MNKRKINWIHIRRKFANIMKVGATDEIFSREYDIISTSAVVINIVAVLLYTFDSMELNYGSLLLTVEAVTVEQVTEAAKTLSLHTVFFLKGVTQ